MAKPIALSKIVEALEDQWAESTSHLNVKTGEIVVVSDEDVVTADDGVDLDEYSDWERDAIETAAKVVESEDYIPLPSQFDVHEYRIMEDFCRSLDDANLRDEMLNAISGRGAFRMFKDHIHRFNIADDWHQYRRAAFREIAIEWCEENGLEYEE